MPVCLEYQDEPSDRRTTRSPKHVVRIVLLENNTSSAHFLLVFCRPYGTRGRGPSTYKWHIVFLNNISTKVMLSHLSAMQHTISDTITTWSPFILLVNVAYSGHNFFIVFNDTIRCRRLCRGTWSNSKIMIYQVRPCYYTVNDSDTLCNDHREYIHTNWWTATRVLYKVVVISSASTPDYKRLETNVW